MQGRVLAAGCCARHRADQKLHGKLLQRGAPAAGHQFKGHFSTPFRSRYGSHGFTRPGRTQGAGLGGAAAGMGRVVYRAWATGDVATAHTREIYANCQGGGCAWKVSHRLPPWFATVHTAAARHDSNHRPHSSRAALIHLRWAVHGKTAPCCCRRHLARFCALLALLGFPTCW